jgi:hypothetical protein
MSKLAKVLILVAVFATLPLNAEDASGQAAGSAPMPDLFWATDGFPREYPLFISAENALLPSGELNLALFGEAAQFEMQADVLDATFEDCHGAYRMREMGLKISRRDFKAIAADADFIVLGKVTGISQGFWISTPGTVLRIEPVRWLKSGDSWAERYLFFPVVEMEFGGKTICFQSEHYPVLPELGWQVLVSYNNADKNRDEPVLRVDSAQIIVFPPEGPASLAKHLREQEPDWAGRSGSALLNDIQALLEETP